MSAADHIDGRVVDERGDPLAGGVVWFSGYPFTKTDEQGRFRVAIPENLRDLEQHNLRFSAPDFRPMTLDVEAGKQVSVSLRHDATAVWTPPSCPVRRSLPFWPRFNDTMMWGNYTLFRFPRGTEVSIRGDDHGSAEKICRGRDCLYRRSQTWEAYSGIEMGTHFIDSFREVREVDIRNGSDTAGAEYRGVLHDGTYSRFVLTVGQDRIAYDGVSETSAHFFDTIIDSMCWFDRD